MIEQTAFETRRPAAHAWLQARRILASSGLHDLHRTVTGAGAAHNGKRAVVARATTSAGVLPAPRAGAALKGAGQADEPALRAAPKHALRTGRHAPGHFEALMQASQDGDRRAYAQLLREVLPLVTDVARRRRPFLDAADIDDLVQETLLSIHLARASYDPRRPFLPWLFAILARRLADAARRHASRSAYEVTDNDAELTAAAEYNDASGAYGDPQLLVRAIRELPRTQRRIVELLKLRELSLKEASAITGMSVSALKVGMHRALASLRKKLGAPMVDGGASVVSE